MASALIEDLRLHVGDGSTDEDVAVRQSVLAKLFRQLDDREALLDVLEVALYGHLVGANRADFLARIQELKRHQALGLCYCGERHTIDEAIARNEQEDRERHETPGQARARRATNFCACGHGEDWHSHGGKCDCEHGPKCGCTAFAPAGDRGLGLARDAFDRAVGP